MVDGRWSMVAGSEAGVRKLWHDGGTQMIVG